MKTIPLTQGKIAIIDNDDFEKISKYKWYAHKNRNTFYANSHIQIGTGKQKSISMHRLILGITDPKILTDHENHNGLDNRKINLRICDFHQNGANRNKIVKRKNKGVTSKYKGVYCDKNTKRWQSQIIINQIREFLGSFDSEIEAALAYDAAALKYFGEFCNLNFPNKGDFQCPD